MAGNYKKWNSSKESNNNNNLHVVLFISRNKDNKDVEGFKERRKSFVSSKSTEELMEDFNIFCSKGVDLETCRFYISFNARDRVKTNKELVHYLIDNPEIPTEDIPAIITAIAARKEQAAEYNWMFDFDDKDENRCNDFCDKIYEIEPIASLKKYKTPNGFHIITNSHFDTRELLKEFPNATLKRDDLTLVKVFTKGVCINEE